MQLLRAISAVSFTIIIRINSVLLTNTSAIIYPLPGHLNHTVVSQLRQQSRFQLSIHVYLSNIIAQSRRL